MGIHAQIPDGTGYNKTGNAVMRSSTPDSAIEEFIAILAKIPLPVPFDKSTKLLLTRWMPNINHDVSLPAIVWKIIHTSLNAKQPLAEKYTHTIEGVDSPVKVYQQNFDHIVQFECYAHTQEEVSVLEWWFVRQAYLYRNIISRAGALAWRYLEAREDFLVTIGKDKYPARPVRFAFTTALTFPVISNMLIKVESSTFVNNSPIVAEEIIVRGNDYFEATNIAYIIEVTSSDGSVYYTPKYDSMSKKFTWSRGQEQPKEDETYLVRYLEYGEQPLAQIISAE